MQICARISQLVISKMMTDFDIEGATFFYTDSYEIAVKISNLRSDLDLCSSNPKINLDPNIKSIAVEGDLSVDYYSVSRDIIRAICFEIYKVAIDRGECHAHAIYLARYPIYVHNRLHRYASLKSVVKNQKFIIGFLNN